MMIRSDLRILDPTRGSRGVLTGLCTLAVVSGAARVEAAPPGWSTYDVALRAGGGSRITRLAFPPTPDGVAAAETDGQSGLGVPVAGFLPYVAILTTDDTRGGSLEFDAVTQPQLSGQVHAPNPATDYAIGIYDTGAPLHVINQVDSNRLGLRLGRNPPVPGGSPFPLGNAVPFTSRPMGLFMDGLGAIDPLTNRLDSSGMVGQSNVSLPVGEGCPLGELFTVVGLPLTMFYCVEMRNDDWRFIRRDGRSYFGPTLEFYEPFDPAIPKLAHRMPLTFTPAGVDFVFYTPGFLSGDPLLPTLVGGLAADARLVVNARFKHGDNEVGSTPMILDLGAQAGLISPVLAAELGLDFANPDFLANIQRPCDVAEEVPGFFIDVVSLPILAPTRLTFERVPVIVLQLAIEQGGIIGTNVFHNRNLVLCPHPFNTYLDISDPLPLDPLDLTRDGVVDLEDVSLFQEVITGPGLDTEPFFPTDLDRDFDADLDDWALLGPNVVLTEGQTLPAAVEIVAYGPVGLLVTDPAGRRLSEREAGIFGAAWTVFDRDADGVDEEVVQMVTFETGTYRIVVEPRPGTGGRSTFSLHAVVNGRSVVLADRLLVGNIPPEPYALVVGLPVNGDLDADGDVDLADVIRFLSCFSGAGQALDADCAAADLDGDGDSDLADFLTLQALVIGLQ